MDSTPFITCLQSVNQNSSISIFLVATFRCKINSHTVSQYASTFIFYDTSHFFLARITDLNEKSIDSLKQTTTNNFKLNI